MSTSGRGLQFKYSSGIAPLVSGKEYSELIANYKKTGSFPHVLKIGGMAVDDSQNRNKWRILKEDLEGIASQLNGSPIMKNHDIENVDAIIGRVNSSWVEGNKVLYEGEISDESLIQKILLGYVRFNSIQIAIPNAYCDNCTGKLGVKEEEASITDLDNACPRCGSYEMYLRKPLVLEQSMVAIPAYEKAEIAPLTFKASIDRALKKRFTSTFAPTKPKVVQMNLTPILLVAAQTVVAAAISVASMTVLRAKIALEEGYPEDKVDMQWSSPTETSKPIGDSYSSQAVDDYLSTVGDAGEAARQAGTQSHEEAEDIFKFLPNCQLCILDKGVSGKYPHEDALMEHIFADHPNDIGEDKIIEDDDAIYDQFDVSKREGKDSALEDFPLTEKKKDNKGEVQGVEMDWNDAPKDSETWCVTHNKGWDNHSELELGQDEERGLE
jgi:hypothetical protein